MKSTLQKNSPNVNPKSNDDDFELATSNAFGKYSQEKIWDDNIEVILRQDINL